MYDNVKLWTIQTEEAFKNFCETGVLLANSQYLYCENYFRYAYDWLAKEMRKRIGNPKNNEIKYPVWAWHTWDRQRKKRNIKERRHAMPGTKMVQLEVEILNSDVVLTDFDFWESIMTESCMQNYVSIEIIKKWQKVFDTKNATKVQATMWSISMEQVIWVEHFIAV